MNSKAWWGLIVAMVLAGCGRFDISGQVVRPGEATATYQSSPQIAATSTLAADSSQSPTPGAKLAITIASTGDNPTLDPFATFAPYPTPGSEVTPWDQLIDQVLVQDVGWAQYRGQIANHKGLWPITFKYPSDWYPMTNPTGPSVYVQNIPESQGPVAGNVVKFEVLWLKEPPVIGPDSTLNLHDLKTVMVAGQPAVLGTPSKLPTGSYIIQAVFQHDGVWFAANGYVTLSDESSSMPDRYGAILLSMIASLDLDGGA